MNKWIYITVLIICSQKLAAQNNCDNLIEDATELYSSGRYEDCINMLENGLNTCSLTKNRKEIAYVLLINSNIEKDSLPGIDKNFRLLLKNNPAFRIQDYNGPDDFKKYYNNYYVYPKLSIGIRPHYCTQKIWVNSTYQIMPDIKTQSDYKTTPFINTNFFLEYRIIEKISFFADAGYFTLNFRRELHNNYWSMESFEKLKFLQLDFGNKYYFLKSQRKFNFYMMGGFSNQYLKKSVLNLTQTKTVVNDIYTGVETKEYNFLSDFNSQNLRNPYVVSLLFGAGAIYRIGYFGIGLDIRTYISVNTLNNKAERFKEHDLINNFSYVDSDFRLHKSDFSLIITYSLYKVKKKKTVGM